MRRDQSILNVYITTTYIGCLDFMTLPALEKVFCYTNCGALCLLGTTWRATYSHSQLASCPQSQFYLIIVDAHHCLHNFQQDCFWCYLTELVETNMTVSCKVQLRPWQPSWLKSSDFVYQIIVDYLSSRQRRRILHEVDWRIRFMIMRYVWPVSQVLVHEITWRFTEENCRGGNSDGRAPWHMISTLSLSSRGLTLASAHAFALAYASTSASISAFTSACHSQDRLRLDVVQHTNKSGLSSPTFKFYNAIAQSRLLPSAAACKTLYALWCFFTYNEWTLDVLGSSTSVPTMGLPPFSLTVAINTSVNLIMYSSWLPIHGTQNCV